MGCAGAHRDPSVARGIFRRDVRISVTNKRHGPVLVILLALNCSLLGFTVLYLNLLCLLVARLILQSDTLHLSIGDFMPEYTASHPEHGIPQRII
jgi:hypothetical protein